MIVNVTRRWMATRRNYWRSQSIRMNETFAAGVGREKDATERSISLSPMTIDNRSPYDYAKVKCDMISGGYFMHRQEEKRANFLPRNFLSRDTNQSLHCMHCIVGRCAANFLQSQLGRLSIHFPDCIWQSLRVSAAFICNYNFADRQLVALQIVAGGCFDWCHSTARAMAKTNAATSHP